MKLFKFIKSVKENNTYILITKQSISKKAHIFYEMRYKNVNAMKDNKNYKKNLNMYRLLVNMIFNDYPEIILA